MKKLVIAAIIFLFGTSIALATGCFLTGERVTGLNKICYYRCIDGDMAITIDACELCPLSL